MKPFVSVLLLTLWAASRAEDEGKPDARGEVIQVSVLMRHGQRTPGHLGSNIVPGDWPEGHMQLTEKGAQQAKSLGTWIRNRYPRLLPKKHREIDILARSTDTARTLSSASAFLEGLYPGQATPVRSAPQGCDLILSPQISCPVYAQEMRRFMSTEEGQREKQKLQALIDDLSPKIGRTLRGPGLAEVLYSTLLIGQQHNLTMPKWGRHVFPEPLRSLSGSSLALGAATSLLARIRYGPLIRDVVQNAESTKTHLQKLFLYSAHDFTIAGLLSALEVYDGMPPGFSSSVIFELRRFNATNDLTIDVYYRNDSYVEARLLEIEGCGRPCYLETFKMLTENLMPKGECDPVVEDRRQTREGEAALDAVMYAAGAIGFLAIGALMALFCSVALRSSERQEPLPSRQPSVQRAHEPLRREYVLLPGKNVYYGL